MATLRGSIVRCLAVSVGSAATVLAGTVHVPGDAPTIQQGIALAADGDTVLVAPGQYLETIDFLGKRLIVESESGPDVTTINAFLAGSVVSAKSGEPAGTELRGFELTTGSGQIVQISNQPFRVGGGVFVDNQSNLLVEDCYISDNKLMAYPDFSFGGGVFARQSHATVSKCRISANSAGNGGSAAYGAGALVLDHCQIFGNHAATPDVPTVMSATLVADCVIQANAGTGVGQSPALRCVILDNSGDGMHIGGPASVPITVSQCAFAGNGSDGLSLSPTIGTGPMNCTVTSCVFYGKNGLRVLCPLMSLGGPDTLKLVNCTFDGGAVIMEAFAANPKLLQATNCILRNVSYVLAGGTTKIFEYCDANPLQPGTGNIDADPLWVDPSIGDYRLAPGSPCINTGSPLSPLDPDGSPADMGALPYDPWNDLGGGVAGSAGLPTLDGTGSLLAGSNLTLKFSGAPAFQSTLLVVGVSQLGGPFKGGTLWPSADIVAPIAAGAGGSWTLPATWPPGLPSALSVWLQVWFPDAGAPQGFAGSDALKATTP
jgi:hypothetical protein